MSKMYLVLETMKVKMVKGHEKQFPTEPSSDRHSIKVYARKKIKVFSGALSES